MRLGEGPQEEHVEASQTLETNDTIRTAAGRAWLHGGICHTLETNSLLQEEYIHREEVRLLLGSEQEVR